MKKLKLTIELVPSSCWYNSLYQYYKNHKALPRWYLLKKEIKANEGEFCFICGNVEKPLELHEFWVYDDVALIQKLEALHHLCAWCHWVKHIGLWVYSKAGAAKLATVGATKADVIKHFTTVNNCSKKTYNKYIKEVFALWQTRSKKAWIQELGKFAALK